MSNVSRLDPKTPSRSPSRSPAPSIYAAQTVGTDSRTWKSEIKSAFIPFDLEEFEEGGIATKIIACVMSPLFLASKFTTPVLDEENLDNSWNKVIHLKKLLRILTRKELTIKYLGTLYFTILNRLTAEFTFKSCSDNF